jgi:hypothetical protein
MRFMYSGFLFSVFFMDRSGSLAATIVAGSDSYKMISTGGSFCPSNRCWQQPLQFIA